MVVGCIWGEGEGPEGDPPPFAIIDSRCGGMENGGPGGGPWSVGGVRMVDGAL